jgi:hypothetical protein
MRPSLCRSASLLGFICVISMMVSCSEGQSLTGQTDAPSTVGGALSVDSPSQSLADAGIGRKTRLPDPGAVAISLTNITVSNQGDHDQAVFEFTGNSIPGWAVQYVAYAVTNGTQNRLPIPGQSILEVLIVEAPGPFTASETYTGPPVVSNPDTPQINVVQYATYGKGITQAFIGLNGVPPFSVSALTDPTRIVVDVAH